ncbi:alpha-N-arabinofuranosidase [Asticcacaulis sp. EMRT-3]|uniref:alpha-N-arabinofuranosidase n=1 Tax=Asticcacaulis sp. EMRT-3 TaxID=3040349 RepID=UPI0024AF6AD8|nr:alpha-N-arabinofuranosidase [Asticcacaulis sp. EMRT-3]MDI7775814.1 alpha-N-arabinofuranosidase [Asticcacaulis sp. EMRT-3]
MKKGLLYRLTSGLAVMACLSPLGLAPLAAQAQSPATSPSIPLFPITVGIDASQTERAISPYEYGMFVEPIGRAVDRTLWAEMLDDRKFYFPIVPKGQDAPPARPSRTGPDKHWRPVGPADAVVMDTKDAYVGDQSPRISLAGSDPRGISQSGLSVVADKAYTGRIVVAIPSGAQGQVSLVWGDGPNDRQSVKLPATGGAWKTVSFSFKPSAASDQARLEITATGTGTGTGDLRIGAVSLMPADNLDGWRADAVAQLKSLHSGMWRLPGGNYLSNWDWHDAIGPQDKRPPMFDHAWDAMQTNDIGMDEWMELCRLIGTMPYVTVNAGLGDANSAAEEVEYLNGPASSYWGGLRAKNGHPAPYGITYWDIGNEPYGDWQIGKTTLQYYIYKHIDFAKRMKKADPSIILLASGAMPDQRKWPGVDKENSNLQSILPKFGTELDWTGGLLAKASDYFSGVTEHWYDTAEARPDAPADDELIEFARQPSNNVLMKADEWNIYRQKYPVIDKKDMFLSIDEYAYFPSPPDLKTSLAYSMVLQEMLRHTDAIRMSAFTMGPATLDQTPSASTLNTTGLVFKLYGEHFGAGVIPVKVTGGTPWPDPKYPVGFDHPQVVAGSPTWPVDVIAALSPDKKKLIIGTVNATYEPRDLVLTLGRLKLAATGTAYRLAGATLDAANKVGQTPGVTIATSPAALNDGKLSVPATSTVIYEFDITGGL